MWFDIIKIEPYEVAVAEQFAPEELTNEKRTEAMAATVKQQIEEAKPFIATHGFIAFDNTTKKIGEAYDKIESKSLDEEINTIDEYVKEVQNNILIPRNRKTLTNGEARVFKTLLVKGSYWKEMLANRKEFIAHQKQTTIDRDERERLNISEPQHQNLKNLRSAWE